MAVISTYALLLAAVADWLNRTDLTAVIPDFVQNAEGTLRRDPRVRQLKTTTISISASPTNLPADFDALESLEHVGTTYYGPLTVVPASAIGALLARLGPTSAPRYVAITDTTMRFAPAPDATYVLPISYWLTLPRLTVSATTNWLLLAHPDIYLYATLVESAPYLKDDARLAVWASELDKRLEQLHLRTTRQQFSGALNRSPKRAIG